MQHILEQFISGLKNTTLLEFIAVISGILSVWLSKKENVLLYPVGLVNTIIFVYLSFKSQLIGESSVNFYYTVMSFYGWWQWLRKDSANKPVLHVAFSTPKERRIQLLVFVLLYGIIFGVLSYLKKAFYPGVIPWADGLATATAFTGMWLMTQKKVESWWWWISTNIASVPLYFVKGMVFTSVYYVVLLVLAVLGLLEWRQRAQRTEENFSWE